MAALCSLRTLPFSVNLTARGFALATFIICVALPPGPVAQSAAPALSAPPRVASEPPNVGDAKAAATAYHDSGAYARDLASVASEASA